MNCVCRRCEQRDRRRHDGCSPPAQAQEAQAVQVVPHGQARAKHARRLQRRATSQLLPDPQKVLLVKPMRAYAPNELQPTSRAAQLIANGMPLDAVVSAAIRSSNTGKHTGRTNYRLRIPTPVANHERDACGAVDARKLDTTVCSVAALGVALFPAARNAALLCTVVAVAIIVIVFVHEHHRCFLRISFVSVSNKNELLAKGFTRVHGLLSMAWASTHTVLCQLAKDAAYTK